MHLNGIHTRMFEIEGGMDSNESSLQTISISYQFWLGWYINLLFIDAKILTSLSGRYIVVLNSNGYYVVLGLNNKNLNRDMMGGEFS